MSFFQNPLPFPAEHKNWDELDGTLKVRELRQKEEEERMDGIERRIRDLLYKKISSLETSEAKTAHKSLAGPVNGLG